MDKVQEKLESDVKLYKSAVDEYTLKLNKAKQLLQTYKDTIDTFKD